MAGCGLRDRALTGLTDHLQPWGNAGRACGRVPTCVGTGRTGWPAAPIWLVAWPAGLPSPPGSLRHTGAPRLKPLPLHAGEEDARAPGKLAGWKACATLGPP